MAPHVLRPRPGSRQRAAANQGPRPDPGGPPAEPIADFPVGGHYRAGEPATSVREVREELGRDIAYTDLHPLGIRQTVATLSDTYIEREFQYWHLLPIEDDLTGIQFNDDEVAGLAEVGIADAIRLAVHRYQAGERTHLFR